MQHTAKNQAEPEPFAWLNEGQEATLDEGCKVLTQFKTVESDDSEKDDQGVIGKIRCVKFTMYSLRQCVIEIIEFRRF